MSAANSSSHRLAGAIEKFNRSKEQFDELLDEVHAFTNGEPKPYSSIGEFDRDAWEWVERFQIREDPPIRFGVILGDCVHNLRSSLDHLVWQVTLLDDRGLPNDDTQYPIASKSEAQFERMADRRIPGLNARHRAMVKQTQPYHRGHEAPAHPLSMLADLSNIDKHQVLHTAYNIVGWDAHATLDNLVKSGPRGAPACVVGWHLASDGRLEHGTPWLRIVWNRGEEPPREVKVDGDLTTKVAFGEIGLPAAEFSKIADAVRKIMEAFMAEFPETQFVA